jgi:predicted ATP-dependent endonuclease of OLD family
MIKINAIKLPDAFDIYKNTDGEKAEFLEPVSKTNIFVGSNNSGKSRFMRGLSMQPDYEIKTPDVDLEEVNSEILNFVEKIGTKFEELKIIEANSLHIDEVERIKAQIPDSLNIADDTYKKIRELLEIWSKYENVRSFTSQANYRVSLGGGTKEVLAKFISLGANRALDYLNKIPVYSETDKPQKVYIPILRGLRPLDVAHTDYYLETTRRDYFHHQVHTEIKESEMKRPEVFTGLSLYKRLTDLLLGNNSERKLINDYQNFISKSLFEDKSVALIPNQKDKVVIVKIGNEKEQPIHHLGDGIQSAIILSFLPFVMQEQTFFFIEEPEMYLHPGLQRKILNFYNSLKQHTFFLTTHSNHFLDITIDIKDVSIFTFRKIFDESDEDELTPNFTVEAVDSGHESSLELLGVRNSSVFLVNATIWVEGITDRWYFRKMLNSYMDYLEETDELDLRLEEDTHYSFVEYGGANITHWSFLDYEEHPIEVERLCAKAVVIIDGDGEKKMKRKEDLERILGERLVILQCREVENLLPYKVIKEIVTEYENNPDLELKDYSYDKYQDEYLGTFIESTMLKSDVKRRGGYRENSGKAGTLKGKLDFCEKALPKIQYEDLPDAAKEIIAEIYRFICLQNR